MAELSEFTHEIFRISSQFLSSSLFHQRVGAVFLLYALFRNQVADPPFKIRIELRQWKVIDELREESTILKYKSLHYVIDYLITHAFVYVAVQNVKGPLTGYVQKVSRNCELVSNLKINYKLELCDYKDSNNLQNLKDLHVEYLECKKKLVGIVKVNLNEDSAVYGNFLKELDDVMNESRPQRRKKHDKQAAKETESIGNRRAKIKAASYARKSGTFHSRKVESESIDNAYDNSEPSPKKRFSPPRPRRKPKSERRIGRPRKYPRPEDQEIEKSDDDIDISHLLSQQKNFYLPPDLDDLKMKKERPMRLHYKLSPKHEDDGNETLNYESSD